MMYSISDRDESLQIEDRFHAIVIVIGLTGDSVSHDRSSIVGPEIPPIGPRRDYFRKTGIFQKYIFVHFFRFAFDMISIP
jgi:hypothetical protein